MDPEIASNGMGIAHLLSQNSGVGLIPFILLVLMSLGTCYYALLKGYLAQREQRLNARFIADFWQHDSVQEMERQLAHLPPQEAYGRLTGTALAAVAQLNRAEERAVSCKLGSPDEYLLRAMRRPSPRSGCGWNRGWPSSPRWARQPLHRAVRHRLGHLPRPAGHRCRRSEQSGQGCRPRG